MDALSFGFVKNGGLAAEALVFFEPGLAEEARIRRKRAGHLMSKGRYAAAQLLALLDEDRWLENARAANAGAAALAAAAAVSPATLADRVASPGGMTREGLNVLDDGAALRRLLTATLRATRDKGAALSQGS